MADTPARPSDSTSSLKAVKDKNCPFCGQAFTSSSLGRHLDLYIKPRNPKAPDGVHDVGAIRQLRRNVTRRSHKGSLARRETSISVGTPTAGSRRSPASDDADSSTFQSPISLKEGPQVSEERFVRKYPFKTPWQATGVINDISPQDPGASRGDGPDEVASAEVPRPQPPPPPSQRAVSRQVLKQNQDARLQVQEALDGKRAAELALRELIGSIRAAKCVRRCPLASCSQFADHFWQASRRHELDAL